MQFSKEELSCVQAIAAEAGHQAGGLSHCFDKILELAVGIVGKMPEGLTAEQEVAFLNCMLIAFQIGLNVGRAQEILQSIGGKKAWWGVWKPLFMQAAAGRPEPLAAKAKETKEMLGL